MMKKCIAAILCAATAMALVACGNDTQAQTETAQVTEAPTTQDVEETLPDEAPATEEEATVGLANPWTEIAFEDMATEIGVNFALPEGAELVSCSVMKDENLGQAIFNLDGMEFVARIKPTAGFEDISGMYYDWTDEADVSISWCDGKFYACKDGDNTIQLCLWCDIVPGVMYSLTVSAPDLDGFDLTAVAEQMFVSMQGDAE